MVIVRLAAALAATAGPWVGGVSTFAYQWLRCTTAACTEIAGATDATYEVAQADVGSWLEVRVTATNANGKASAISGATQFAVAAPSSPAPTPPLRKSRPKHSGTHRR